MAGEGRAMRQPDDKKTLREIVASALAAGLTTDQIAAMAFADRLGCVLWRLKYANDAAAYQPALQLITRRMRQRKGEGRALLQKIAARSLLEYLDDKCNQCGGRGMVYAMSQAVHVCTECSGTGIKYHTDFERARAIGVPLERYPKFASRFARASEVIANADAFAARDIAAQLRTASCRNA